MLKKTLKGLLALFMAVTMLNVSLAGVRAAVQDEIIDDTDARWTYSEGGANDGGWGSAASSEPADSEHWSNTAGATATLSFNGEGLEVYGIKAPNHYNISIAIDEGEAAEAECYAASRTDGNTLIYKSPALAAGDHTAVITVLDTANEAAVNPTGISLTYAKALNAEVSEPVTPEFPGYTIVEDVQTTDSDELFKIHYNGSWSGGSSYYPNLFHDGYEHYAHTGDSYDIRFIGSKVEIVASKNQAHGVYTVTIDGQDAGTADATTTGATTHQQLIYTSDELTYGPHTMHVELVGQDGKAIQLDYLKIYHEPLSFTEVHLDRAQAVTAPGGSIAFTASVSPWNAEGSLVWSSSDESKATVENGVVTVAGDVEEKTSVIIKAASAADETIFAQAEVIIDPAMEVVNAYVANEKLLERKEDYANLASQSGSSWSGTAWKGDIVNSKINVVSMGTELKNVQAAASDFTSEKGTVLDASNIKVSWLENASAKNGRNAGGTLQNYPDRIGDAASVNIPAEDVRFAWVQISVPEGTPAGTYTGTVQISADNLKSPVALSYTLEVLNLDFPKDQMSELQIWQHPYSAANYYLGLGSEPSGGISYDSDDDFYFTENHFNLMRSTMKEYAAAGGHDVVANIVEQAWNHQSYYNDSTMVEWTKNADGTWSFDYEWFDKWIEFQIECGVIDPATGLGQIKCYSIVPWNNQVTYYDVANSRTIYQSFTPGADDWKEIWTTFLTDFMAHVEEKGWLDITYISMDERGLSQLEPAVELIRSIKNAEGKSFKISSALNYAAPEYYDFTDQIDDISINQGNATNRAQMEALCAHRAEKGLKTTLYTCTGDYPSSYMISDPGDNYWTLWYSFSLGADGFMRWAYDNYVYDMYGDATYRYWEPGDGWLIYPENRENVDETYQAGFYSSPRWEMMKQGVRDTSKARWLLANEKIAESDKQALRDALSAMSKPAASTRNGAAVPANDAARMSAHNQTAAVQSAMDALGAIASAMNEPEPAKADKTLLKQAVDYAEALKAETDFTVLNQLVAANFEKALQSAKDVLASETADQAAVNAAWTQLAYAIHLMDFRADKSALAALVEEAKAIDLGQYADGEAKDAFVTALENAKAVLESETALDASIEAACNALRAAMAALEPAGELDTRTLAWLIAQVEGADLSLYLDAGKEALNDALNAARAVLAAPESQNQIDAATDALSDAWLAMRLRPDESVLAALQSFVEEVSALDLSAYDADVLAPYLALKADIEKGMQDASFDKNASEDLLSRVNALAPVSSLARKADTAGTAGSSANAAASAASVKTSAGMHGLEWTLLGAAALGALAMLKARRK